MKTRSRLTKKRARGLDISALQHRTAKFAVCQHKLQTKFFFSKTMIFLFSQARIRKFLKGAQVGGGEAWAGGGGLGGRGARSICLLIGEGVIKAYFRSFTI